MNDSRLRMAGWFAETERPIYTCIGGPKDGCGITAPRFSGAYEDAQCREAGGCYRLQNRREGRFLVPVAVWAPKEGHE